MRQADAAGFDKVFVTETNALNYNMREGNDTLARELRQHPDRLIGYVSVPSPRLGKAAVEEVRRCHEKYGMRGLKLYSLPEASIAEPLTFPLLEVTAQFKMPVLSHITPDEADYLMTHVPAASILMAHMGGHPTAQGDWHRAITVAKKHKNLLLDTASSQIDNGMIEHAVAEVGAERVIFGTDMPLLDPFTQREGRRRRVVRRRQGADPGRQHCEISGFEMKIDINACFGHWPYWELPHCTPESLTALMDRNGIDAAAVMCLRGIFHDWREGNRETREAAAQCERLIPFATISPFLGGDAEALTALLKEGFLGVRLYPAFHSYTLGSIFVDEICAAAAEQHAPVMIPTRPMMNWRFKPLEIQSIAQLAQQRPRTTIILSGPNYLVESQGLVEAMLACRNIVYEISCMQGFRGISKLVDCVGFDRVLLGTGSLLQNPACNVAKLDNAEISQHAREAIGAGNAMRLLRLEEIPRTRTGLRRPRSVSA